MENFDLIIKILVPLAIGAVVGIERQVDPVDDSEKQGRVVMDMGLRTFALTGLIGGLAGLASAASPVIAGIITTTFLILILINYTIGVIYTKDLGITTEISLFYTYFAGILIAAGIVPIAIILAITVIVVLLLSQKRKIHKTISTIDQKEFNSFIGFAILALVILPFLPNYSFAFSQIPGLKTIAESAEFLERVKDINLINPFKLWLIVVLMTGVDIAGYILERTFGRGKSLLITSLAGGFISSTATTQSLANQSKNLATPNLHVGASLFSNMTSFVQISILIAAVNSALFFQSLPVVFSLIVTTFISGIFFFLRNGKGAQFSTVEKTAKHQIFNLVPALKFMGLFLLINILSKVSLEFLGDSGFLITSALGALAGIDAVVISSSELAGSRIDFKLAILGILIANAVNLIAKTFYAFSSGAKNFALRFGVSVIFIIGLSLLTYFIF